jgi:hypothetical protein|tara:strand:+ start:9699 stop:10061 length:363 start_codon:yes stop_codon:yes gene_type:complete
MHVSNTAASIASDASMEHVNVFTIVPSASIETLGTHVVGFEAAWPSCAKWHCAWSPDNSAGSSFPKSHRAAIVNAAVKSPNTGSRIAFQPSTALLNVGLHVTSTSGKMQYASCPLANVPA